MAYNQKLVDHHTFILMDGRSFRITSAEVRNAKAEYDPDDDVQALKEVTLRAGISRRFASEVIRMMNALYKK